jgi:chromosome segregation ATPase
MTTRKRALCLLMMLLLCLTPAFAQSSAPGTSASVSVDKNRVIGRLLKEIDEGRAYIARLEEREHALEDEAQKARQAHEELTDAHAKALVELGELHATIKFQKEALAERETQVTELRGDVGTARAERDQAQAKVKSLKRENLTLKAGGLLFLAGVVYVLSR